MYLFFGQWVGINPCFAAGLNFGDFLGYGFDLAFIDVKAKIDCEKTALMWSKLRNPAKYTLNRSVEGKARTRLKPRYIAVLVGHRIFPEREER